MSQCKATCLVAVGDIANAVHIIQSSGFADATDATAVVLQGMLCPALVQRPPDRSWVDRRNAEAVVVNRLSFLKTLRSAAKFGAADLAGPPNDHFQLSLDSKGAFVSFMEVCSLIASGLLPDQFDSLAALGRETPLRKGVENKLRPLACGFTWRRSQLGFEQYAVSVKSALEKLREF